MTETNCPHPPPTSEREYASEQAHLYLLLALVAVVIIGAALWLMERQPPRR